VENRSLRGRFKDANLIPLGLFANQAAVAIANATLHEALEAKVAERTASLQTALAQLTAEMVERQRIEQDLRRLASYDTLTGALNRRCFYEQGQAQLTLAVERRLPLAVLLFDLDRFKQINDHHGHVAGDIILRHFASLCQSNAPDGVLFGRLGGEEFAMLLPGNDDKIATRIAERIRSACAEMVTTVNQQPVRVTVSIGVVTMARTSLTLDLLLERADQAMYISKHRGGNCVTTYTRQRSELSVNACVQPTLVMA
jgi:diguanylate cyclase (GGDEF)-like protein